MKKILYLFLLLSSPIFGQHTLIEQDIFKEKIKTVEVKTFAVIDNQIPTSHNYYLVKSFGQNGKIQNLKYFGNDLKLDTEEIYFYNSKLQLTKTEISMGNGRLDKIIYHEYNDKGDISKEIKTNAKNETEYESKFQYNTVGLLESKIQKFFNIDYEINERYLYNTQKQLLEAFKETHSGISKDKFTYNAKGLLLSKDEYNAKNELFSSTLYEYNEKGDKIALIKTDLDGNISYFEQYEYIYDAKGNWIEKNIYIKGVFSSQEKRVLVYY